MWVAIKTKAAICASKVTQITRRGLGVKLPARKLARHSSAWSKYYWIGTQQLLVFVMAIRKIGIQYMTNCVARLPLAMVIRYSERNSTPGNAQCLLMSNPPTQEKMADSECEAERDTHGHRLGSAHRLAVYKMSTGTHTLIFFWFVQCV